MNRRGGEQGPAGRLRWPGSIGSRLVLAFAGVSVFTLLVVGTVFYVFLGGYVVERNKEQLLEQATEVAEQVEAMVEMMPNAMSRTGMLNVLIRSDLRVLPSGAGIVIFRGGEAVARAGTLPVKEQNLSRIRREGERLGADGPGSDVITSLGDLSGREVDLLVAAAPIRPSDGPNGLAVVTLARSDAFAARSGLVRVLAVSGIIAVALAIGVGLGLGSWMVRPLRRLSLAARNMAQGVYDLPVTGTYPGEVQELATSLEVMRREVHHSEESLRAFVGSAAHELRTPLTSIEGFSQALLDGTAASEEERQRSVAAIYRESARLRRLVDALLTLSRYDSGEFRPSNAKVSLHRLAKEEVERLAQTGAVTAARIGIEFASEVWMVTDADMLRQVLCNLLQNAVQYGGEDPIVISGAEEGGVAVLEVRSGGVPLTADEKDRIFDRFYRGRQSVGGEGFGLGLPLVREICGVLGGGIELARDVPETVFRVRLPMDPSAGGA